MRTSPVTGFSSLSPLRIIWLSFRARLQSGQPGPGAPFRRRPPAGFEVLPGRESTPSQRGRSARAGETGLVGEDDRLDPVTSAQLGEHALDVRLDRRFLDDELGGDLCVRETPRHEREHLALARGELLEPRVALRIGRGLPGHALDHAAGHGGREERVAGGDRVDRGDQLLRPGSLEQESGGARVQGAEDVVVLLEGGEDHDLHLRERGQQLASGGDAVEVRHPHVHEDHVRFRQPRAVGGLASVARLADQLDRLVAREHAAQAGAHEIVVVDDQHPNAGFGHDRPSAKGRRACSSKLPLRAPTSKLPPSSAARSRMPTTPWPPPVARAVSSGPIGLATVTSSTPGPKASSRAALPSPCRAALVSASWRMRYAPRSTRGGSGRRSPLIVVVTRRPAALCRSTRPSSAASPGGGSTSRVPSGSEASSRRAPTIWSISPTVSRATCSIVSNAWRARAGSRSACRRPIPAWTRITLIACPAESCRSRAIRPRSSAAARRRSRSASRSARSARSSSSAIRSRRSLVRSPASHAPPQTVIPNRISAPRIPPATTCTASMAATTPRVRRVRSREPSLENASRYTAMVGPTGGPTGSATAKDRLLAKAVTTNTAR